MAISEWISLSLALVTLIGVIVALIFGIRSIREGRILQLVRYQNDLLEKISDWLANVQNLYFEASPIEELYSFEQFSSDFINFKLALTRNLSRRASAYGRVVEEGRNIYGIAVFISKDLCEATKSLEACLQRNFEAFLKYSKLVEDTSSYDELSDIVKRLDKDHTDGSKSIDASIIKVIGEIFDARVDMLDSVIKGADPLKNV